MDEKQARKWVAEVLLEIINTENLDKSEIVATLELWANKKTKNKKIHYKTGEGVINGVSVVRTLCGQGYLAANVQATQIKRKVTCRLCKKNVYRF
jgi:hypothetical protein